MSNSEYANRPTQMPRLLAVAEEGIDVRSCQLVVRYDLPDTAQVRRCMNGDLSCCWS